MRCAYRDQQPYALLPGAVRLEPVEACGQLLRASDDHQPAVSFFPSSVGGADVPVSFFPSSVGEADVPVPNLSRAAMIQRRTAKIVRAQTAVLDQVRTSQRSASASSNPKARLEQRQGEGEPVLPSILG